LYILIESLDQFCGLADQRCVSSIVGVDEKDSFESQRVSVEYFGDKLDGSFRVHWYFLGFEVHQQVPFLDHPSNQHVLLEWGKQISHCAQIIPLLVLLGVASIGSDDDHGRVVVVPAISVQVAQFEYVPSLLVEAGYEFILVPFFVKFDSFGHL
jgi:hypothetical protein